VNAYVLHVYDQHDELRVTQ